MYVIKEIIYSELKISQAIMTRLTVLVFSCCILFMKQFTEHRINIILVADMLHRKVVESRLQMLLFSPQCLMRATCNFDIAVITNNG